MGNLIGLSRAFLWLALLLPMLAAAACSPTGLRFDIPAQPAGSALNEFAKQADITLIFSYDMVSEERTQALKGRHTVDHGLAILLRGTGLSYRQATDGTYLICPQDACARIPGSNRQRSNENEYRLE